MGKKKAVAQKVDRLLSLQLVLPSLRLPNEANEFAEELFWTFGVIEEATPSAEETRLVNEICDMEDKIKMVLPEGSRLLFEYAQLTCDLTNETSKTMFARGLYIGMMLAATEQKAEDIISRFKVKEGEDHAQSAGRTVA